VRCHFSSSPRRVQGVGAITCPCRDYQWWCYIWNIRLVNTTLNIAKITNSVSSFTKTFDLSIIDNNSWIEALLNNLVQQIHCLIPPIIMNKAIHECSEDDNIKRNPKPKALHEKGESIIDLSLLTEYNGHIDIHVKWTINYVLIVCNNLLSVINLGAKSSKNG